MYVYMYIYYAAAFYALVLCWDNLIYAGKKTPQVESIIYVSAQASMHNLTSDNLSLP